MRAVEVQISDVEFARLLELRPVGDAQIARGARDQPALFQFTKRAVDVDRGKAGRVGKLFLGSVTQNIILHADVPVLVVKAPAA